MDPATYTLQQLAELSGVEARTIRSYIERDLLPGPHGMGPKASYGPEHLHRLEVIRLLRDARRDITLDGIRTLLAQLTPEQIVAIASGERRIGSFVDAEPPPLSSALGYLKAIAGRGAASAPKPIRQATARIPLELRVPPEPRVLSEPRALPEPRAPAGTLTPFEELLGTLGDAVKHESVARATRSATWHRVEITPDIELSVRGQLDTDQLAVLQRIGDHLRHLFLKGTRS